MNARQRLFCEEYLSNGFKPKDAYRTVYRQGDENPDLSYAYELLYKPEIQEYITKRRNEIYDSMCIDANRVMLEIADLAFEPKGYTNKTTKLQALALLSKNLGLNVQRTENKDTIEISLVEDNDEL